MYSISDFLRGGVLLAMITSLLFPFLSVFRVCLYPNTYLPDFMTNASLALIDSLLFLTFFCAPIPQRFQGLLVSQHILARLHDQRQSCVDRFITLLDLLLRPHGYVSCRSESSNKSLALVMKSGKYVL